MRFVNPHKVKDGEEVSLNSPLYVNVNVISSWLGRLWAYVQGIIQSVAEQAGRKDCVSIDELEALNKKDGMMMEALIDYWQRLTTWALSKEGFEGWLRLTTVMFLISTASLIILLLMIPIFPLVWLYKKLI